MKHHMYFTEGLPGMGKTTHAMELKNSLQSENLNCVLFTECEKNPLDLSRCAILTEEEYTLLKKKISDKESADQRPDVLRKLDSVCEHDGERVYVFFQSLYEDKSLNPVAAALQQRDVYNGHCDFEFFRKVHLERWRAFAASDFSEDTVFICDALLLQSPLFELMGFYDLPFDMICRYITELYDSVKAFFPIVHYNRVNDVAKAMRYVCECRRNDSGRWERGFYKWMELSPYCRNRNYHGFDGMCAFLSERQSLELRVLEKTGIPCVFIERDF